MPQTPHIYCKNRQSIDPILVTRPLAGTPPGSIVFVVACGVCLRSPFFIFHSEKTRTTTISPPTPQLFPRSYDPMLDSEVPITLADAVACRAYRDPGGTTTPKTQGDMMLLRLPKLWALPTSGWRANDLSAVSRWLFTDGRKINSWILPSTLWIGFHFRQCFGDLGSR